MINKIDKYFFTITNKILIDGKKDINPRPKYEDGEPAHTLSINHCMMQFDLNNREFPIMSIRPVTYKSAIGEILWIYQDESNDLNLLKDKYNIKWWDKWALEDNTIGSCYGETVRKHNLMNNLLNGIKNDPDGRRHIINLWQEDDFKYPHALKPCCYQTVWNVRHESDGDYLDMCMFQRSVDWLVAGSTINQTQYAALLCIVAKSLNLKPGVYTWFAANVQIYDRHIDIAKKLLTRRPIECSPYMEISDSAIISNDPIENFKNITLKDITIEDYPIGTIGNKNRQVKFDLGI